MTVITSIPQFFLGRVLITLAACKELAVGEIQEALDRYQSGDWGDLDLKNTEDIDESLAYGGELFSVYHDKKGTKFWIHTKSDRTETLVFLDENR